MRNFVIAGLVLGLGACMEQQATTNADGSGVVSNGNRETETTFRSSTTSELRSTGGGINSPTDAVKDAIKAQNTDTSEDENTVADGVDAVADGIRNVAN